MPSKLQKTGGQRFSRPATGFHILALFPSNRLGFAHHGCYHLPPLHSSPQVPGPAVASSCSQQLVLEVRPHPQHPRRPRTTNKKVRDLPCENARSSKQRDASSEHTSGGNPATSSRTRETARQVEGGAAVSRGRVLFALSISPEDRALILLQTTHTKIKPRGTTCLNIEIQHQQESNANIHI